MKKLFLLFIVICISALSFVSASAKDDLLLDGAGLLTEAEAQKLSELLSDASEELGYDIVIVTVNSIGNKNAIYYAEDLFIKYGYGAGEDKDGILFLLSMEYRDWAIYSTDMSNSTANMIGESIVPYLSEGDYYRGFSAFADEVSREVVDMRTFPMVKNIVIATVVGLVIALIVVSVMKGQLKTVENRNHAREYIRRDSFQLQRSRDLDLYSTITRVPRPRDNGGGRPGGRSGGGRHGGR